LVVVLLVGAMAAVPSDPGTARADGLEEEARRQVELARTDLDAGAYQRAITACDSALRLDPGRDVQTEAFKIKGLALEQLGERDDARAMLLAFKSLRSGLPDDPEVEDALARMDRGRRPQGRSKDHTPRERRAPPPPPSKAVLLPVLATIGGAGASAVGFTVMGLSYDEAAPRLDLEAKLYLGDRADYVTLQERNRLGFQIGLGGAAVAGIGLVLTLVAASQESGSKQASAPVPWVVTSADGWMIGIAGDLP
jgi:tetratricopeptide (TPR) repeat protein